MNYLLNVEVIYFQLMVQLQVLLLHHLLHSSVKYLPFYYDYQNYNVLQINKTYIILPIEYQNDPPIVRIQPTTLIVVSGWWNKKTEMIIMHTCFTFPVILITRGDVDFVASKFEIFNANAVKPWKRRRKYTNTS